MTYIIKNDTTCSGAGIHDVAFSLLKFCSLFTPYGVLCQQEVKQKTIENHMFKIAVVEDDKPIQILYKTKLEFDGFEVVTADNGHHGLSVLEAERPDLALVDLRMPIMGGDEMLARLRESQWGANIRVIILTNISRDEAPSALRFLNVDRYLVKAHHTPKQVVEIVTEVLARN